MTTATPGPAIGPRRRRRGSHPAQCRIDVRLSQQEHDLIAAAARRGPGRPVSLSWFVAEAALAAAGGPSLQRRAGRAPSRLALAEVMAAVTAVNRVGNNLNQLARERNVTELRPIGTRDAEQRALAALHQLAEIAERLVDEAS